MRIGVFTVPESSSFHLPSTGYVSSGFGRPALLYGSVRPPYIGDGREEIPCAQRTGVAIAHFDTLNPHRYTDGFLANPNSGSPHVARLRPASWGSHSQVEEAFESRR